MRSLFVLPFVVGVGLVACSSDEDAADECQIVGTYTVEETKQSGTCAPIETRDTFTISRRDGAYVVETAGVTGGCPAELVGACKLQTKCDIEIEDAIDPNQSIGTLQFSWSFNASGLTGTLVVSVPPRPPIPDGCTGEFSSAGTRK